jgi:hypothetical protein
MAIEIGAELLHREAEHLAHKCMLGGMMVLVAGKIEPQDKFGHRSIAPVDDTASRVALVERIRTLRRAGRHRTLLRTGRRILMHDPARFRLRSRWGKLDCFVILA